MPSFVVMWTLTFGCGHVESADAPKGQAATAVKVVSVETSSARDALGITGTVEAEETAEIRVEGSGPVSQLGFDHGQRVKKGDVLLRLRGAEAAAGVAEAGARLSLAKTQSERIRGLFERSNASRQDVDVRVAEEALAQAQLERANEALRRTVVRAPFDGVVGLRGVALGEVVDPSRVVARIEAIDRVVVDVEIPERWLPRMSVGLPASIEVDALPGERFVGDVIFVGPRISSSTRTAPVRVRVPNEHGRLRPGMSARVSLTTADIPDAILVPAQAVVSTATGSAVWVVDAEGVVQPRPVETAERTADEVRIVGGLAVGENVVVEGLIRLRPGNTVRVMDAMPPTEAAP